MVQFMYGEKIYIDLNLVSTCRLLYVLLFLNAWGLYMNKKLKLNMKFENGKVICAKSPDICKECSSKINCETINIFYNQYNRKDIIECFNNSEKRR